MRVLWNGVLILKRRFAFGLSGVILLSVVGCGPPVYWVSFNVGLNTFYYVFSPNKVSTVGKMLWDFHVKHPVNYASAGWDTNDEFATEVYLIPSVDQSKEVAVKLDTGTYVEANSVGKQKPLGR